MHGKDNIYAKITLGEPVTDFVLATKTQFCSEFVKLVKQFLPGYILLDKINEEEKDKCSSVQKNQTVCTEYRAPNKGEKKGEKRSICS